MEFKLTKISSCAACHDNNYNYICITIIITIFTVLSTVIVVDLTVVFVHLVVVIAQVIHIGSFIILVIVGHCDTKFFKVTSIYKWTESVRK